MATASGSSAEGPTTLGVSKGQLRSTEVSKGQQVLVHFNYYRLTFLRVVCLPAVPPTAASCDAFSMD